MPITLRLAPLLAEVVREPDASRALDAIANAALTLTGGRHSLIAVLDEEMGHLVIRAAAGEGFSDDARQTPLPLHVGPEDGIIGFVAATGTTFVSGDVRTSPHYRMLVAGTRSEIAVPVHDRHNRVRAVLNVESDQVNAYTESVRTLAEALAPLIAIVLEREDQSRREEALIQVGGSLSEALTEDALIDRVIQVAEQVLRLQACSIFLIDPRTDTFVLRGTSGMLRDMVDRIAYEREEGFTGWVCHHKVPILLDEPQGDSRWRGKYVEFPSELVASFLAVPIVSRGVGVGAIRVLRRKSENRYLDNRFHADDQRLLMAISREVAIGLEHVRDTERRIRDERMIAWGELSAKSSHMIGNRVFALKGDLNELRHVLNDPVLDPKLLRELQESLTTNVDRIEEILQDFRDFVTATQLNRGATDLNRLVGETVEEVFPKRGAATISVALDDSIPKMSLDGKRLRRAVSELIENALTHVPEGNLSISTRLIQAGEDDRTRGSAIARYARLEIADNGPGVPQGRKSVIFQPFFSGRVKGMGLGLSIVKGIVDAHGGHIYESGEEGSGARFVILLPVLEGKNLTYLEALS